MITGYRDHGHMLACGMDPKGVMAELTGRARRLFQGQGRLDAHVLRARRASTAGTALSARQVPIGTGLAFANRYRGNDAVCLTFFGDGAANQGQVYESFNMAELWKLPVVYVIENNRYAMGTSVSALIGAGGFFQTRACRSTFRATSRRHGRARGKAAGDEAVAWCRSGKGPTILEMMTYRYRGHSMSDPAKYRTKEEVDKVRTEHDPIEQVRARLLAKKWASEDELKKIDASVRARCQRSVRIRHPRFRAGSVRTLHGRLSVKCTACRPPRAVSVGAITHVRLCVSPPE